MPTVCIRADGNRRIGSGHLVRCAAVARRICELGASVRFAVSNERSGALLARLGFEYEIVGGDAERLGYCDGERLARLAGSFDAVLVDSYGVSEGFFCGLRASGVSVAYIDDAYGFGTGWLERPVRWDVDAVVNYGFGFDMSLYEDVYSGSETRLLIGPSFAPVRRAFRDASVRSPVRRDVRDVLVTTGSTNPRGCLERMARGCKDVLPGTSLRVVVGSMAAVDARCMEDAGVEILEGLDDLSSWMARSDLVLSAAGTTLYELGTVCVPTVAFPIVENQVLNARGFELAGMGLSAHGIQWTRADVSQLVSEMLDPAARGEYRRRMADAMDGDGASRIARGLLLLAR